MVPMAQIEPRIMKDVLVLDGWSIRKEDGFNWLLAKGEKYIPIPKKCKTLPFEIMNGIFEEADLRGQRYLDLLTTARSIPALANMPTTQLRLQ